MKEKDSAKCKEWERRRREKLNDAFQLLAQLLPNHDPAKTIAKIDILERSTQFVKELRLSNSRLLSHQAETDEKCKIITQLKDEVNKLILRVKQLTSLLKQAHIPIPIGPSIKSLGKKKLKWSEKLAPENLENATSNVSITEKTKSPNSESNPSIILEKNNASKELQANDIEEVPLQNNVPLPLKESNTSVVNEDSVLEPSSLIANNQGKNSKDTIKEEAAHAAETESIAVQLSQPQVRIINAEPPTTTATTTSTLVQPPPPTILPMQTFILTSCPITSMINQNTSPAFTRISVGPTRIFPKHLNDSNVQLVQKIPILPMHKSIPPKAKKRRKTKKNVKIEINLESKSTQVEFDVQENMEKTSEVQLDQVQKSSQVVVADDLQQIASPKNIQTNATELLKKPDESITQQTDKSGITTDLSPKSSSIETSFEISHNDPEAMEVSNNEMVEMQTNEDTPKIDGTKDMSVNLTESTKLVASESSTQIELHTNQVNDLEIVILSSKESSADTVTDNATTISQKDNDSTADKDLSSSEKVSIEKMVEKSQEIPIEEVQVSILKNTSTDDNSILKDISKSTAAVEPQQHFSTETHQAQTHPNRIIEISTESNDNDSNFADLTQIPTPNPDTNSSISDTVNGDKISECIARSIDLIDAPDGELMELADNWGDTTHSPKSPISPTQMFLSMFPLLPRESIVAVSEGGHLQLGSNFPTSKSSGFNYSSHRSFFIDSMLPEDNSESNANLQTQASSLSILDTKSTSNSSNTQLTEMRVPMNQHQTLSTIPVHAPTNASSNSTSKSSKKLDTNSSNTNTFVLKTVSKMSSSVLSTIGYKELQNFQESDFITFPPSAEAVGGSEDVLGNRTNLNQFQTHQVPSQNAPDFALFKQTFVTPVSSEATAVSAKQSLAIATSSNSKPPSINIESSSKAHPISLHSLESSNSTLTNLTKNSTQFPSHENARKTFVTSSHQSQSTPSSVSSTNTSTRKAITDIASSHAKKQTLSKSQLFRPQVGDFYNQQQQHHEVQQTFSNLQHSPRRTTNSSSSNNTKVIAGEHFEITRNHQRPINPTGESQSQSHREVTNCNRLPPHNNSNIEQTSKQLSSCYPSNQENPQSEKRPARVTHSDTTTIPNQSKAEKRKQESSCKSGQKKTASTANSKTTETTKKSQEQRETLSKKGSQQKQFANRNSSSSSSGMNSAIHPSCKSLEYSQIHQNNSADMFTFGSSQNQNFDHNMSIFSDFSLPLEFNPHYDHYNLEAHGHVNFHSNTNNVHQHHQPFHSSSHNTLVNQSTHHSAQHQISQDQNHSHLPPQTQKIPSQRPTPFYLQDVQSNCDNFNYGPPNPNNSNNTSTPHIHHHQPSSTNQQNTSTFNASSMSSTNVGPPGSNTSNNALHTTRSSQNPAAATTNSNNLPQQSQTINNNLHSQQYFHNQNQNPSQPVIQSHLQAHSQLPVCPQKSNVNYLHRQPQGINTNNMSVSSSEQRNLQTQAHQPQQQLVQSNVNNRCGNPSNSNNSQPHNTFSEQTSNYTSNPIQNTSGQQAKPKPVPTSNPSSQSQQANVMHINNNSNQLVYNSSASSGNVNPTSSIVSNSPSTSRPVNWMTDSSFRTNKSSISTLTPPTANPFSVSKLVGSAGNNSVQNNSGAEVANLLIQPNTNVNNIKRPGIPQNNPSTTNYCAEALIRKNPSQNISNPPWTNQSGQQNHHDSSNVSSSSTSVVPSTSGQCDPFHHHHGFNEDFNFSSYHHQHHQQPPNNSHHYSNNIASQNQVAHHPASNSFGSFDPMQQFPPPTQQTHHQNFHFPHQNQNNVHPHIHVAGGGATTSSVSNFNLSTIFPEINDKRHSNSNGSNNNIRNSTNNNNNGATNSGGGNNTNASSSGNCAYYQQQTPNTARRNGPK